MDLPNQAKHAGLPLTGFIPKALTLSAYYTVWEEMAQSKIKQLQILAMLSPVMSSFTLLKLTTCAYNFYAVILGHSQGIFMSYFF